MIYTRRVVRYETWYGGEERPPERFVRAVHRAAEAQGVRRLCEIGAGANPMLSLDVAGDAGIERYVVTDVSEEELAKAPQGYEKVVADVTRTAVDGVGDFDLIISHTVAEHVTDPAGFHRTVLGMLARGGHAMHFFPTLYEPAFVVNRLLPEAAAERILQRIQPDRERGGLHQKFPAYYRWCRGPTGRQLARLTGVGFEVDEYVGIYGHDYYSPVRPIDRLQTMLADTLARHPVPSLTAYAWVSLRRP
jgi:2-polyprenyl-3-methyl-5-hydroxy-6-metoxy-1,4-benzoquinol methylase